LAKGTLEGSWRYDYGIKKPEEFKSIGTRDRVVRKVEEGPFKGSYAHKKYSSEDNEVVISPAPQVGFLNPKTKEYDFYLIEGIPTKEECQKNGYDIENPECLLIPMEHADRVLVALKGKGIDVKIKEELDYPLEKGQKWLCNEEETKDDIVLRAISKIAFNYLAYGLLTRDRLDFIFYQDFNVMRRYIRYGEKPEYPLIVPSQKAILADEPITGKRRQGHLITIDWAGDRVSILAQVSLLNWMTYKICLAREFSGEHIDIKRGNFFDFNSHQIFDLGSKPKSS
jgi:hypothetical protein